MISTTEYCQQDEKFSNFKKSTQVYEAKTTSCESPRYARKKRYVKHQAKRLVTHNIKDVHKFNFSEESISNIQCENTQHMLKKTVKMEQEVLGCSSNTEERLCQNAFNPDESGSGSVSDEQNNVQLSFRCKRKRSCSYPGGHKNSVVCPSSLIGCHCISVTCDCPKLNTDNAGKNVHGFKTQIVSSKSCNTVDSNLLESYPLSRQSSTSTVRERNNSVDSAISQMSIIDISELDDICVNDGSVITDTSSSAWKQHSRSKSDVSCSSNQPEVEECSDLSFSSSLPSSLSENTDSKKKSIFEGGQMIVPTECFFPRPQQGQSLTSFLSSNEFNIRAELDKENAHFCIAEAMISAIERIKCSKTSKFVQEEDESDEEIRKLTQRIRIRRRERQREKTMRNFVFWNDVRADTTTSQSASPPVSSHSSDYEVDSIGSEDEIEDMELSDRTESNLSSMKENGLSLSMASLYSDADLQKVPCFNRDNANKRDSDVSNLTAESVALALLRRFSEKQLPKASDLEWLVSETEAPQRLLPLPDSWPVSPDTVEEEYCTEKIRLRGNLDWAPPRPQIIFIVHAPVKRKVVIEKQKYQCAGCGMKIEHSYISRFRYCNYFGKYFCQCCHSNDQAYIPGRILWKWDFTKYYVSKIAWNLLDQMFGDPLFSVIDINMDLYRKVKQLEACRVYRTQLFYLKDFIRTCRNAQSFQSTLEQYNRNIIYEPHMYSLSDLLQVQSGKLGKSLYQLVNHCTNHIKHCVLCQAKGFICEVCDKASDIIYPFQLDKVLLCDKCGSCFHKRCYRTGNCPKCLRIQERKKRLQEENNIVHSEEEL